MAYTISRSGCYRFPWINREVQTECGRCGLLYRFQHFCKALTRKCYICHNYGHYSRFCHHQHVAARTTVAACQVKQQTKPKSTKKQARDHNRLILFRQRKSVWTLMPFMTSQLQSCLNYYQMDYGQPFKKNSKNYIWKIPFPILLLIDSRSVYRQRKQIERSRVGSFTGHRQNPKTDWSGTPGICEQWY